MSAVFVGEFVGTATVLDAPHVLQLVHFDVHDDNDLGSSVGSCPPTSG